MNRSKLSDAEIAEGLKKLDGWGLDGKHLKKRFEFENFAESLAFVNKTGAIAEDTRSSSRHHLRLGLRRNLLDDP